MKTLAHCLMHAKFQRLALLALACALAGPLSAAPLAGETYVYRLLNGYNSEARANVTYRVDKVEADRVSLFVSADRPAVELERTEFYTSEGNGLRRVLISHHQPHEFEFASPFPAYGFPLEPGKSWSTRISAINLTTGKRHSVRVDGRVVGSERIRVPAGEFDTFKIRRSIYVGDSEGFRLETNITEFDWYAPSIGRSVRLDTKSGFMDTSKCGRYGCEVVRGDWNVYELVSRSGPANAALLVAPAGL